LSGLVVKVSVIAPGAAPYDLLAGPISLREREAAQRVSKGDKEMKLLSKGAILTAAGALVLGTSVALSSTNAVFGASQPHNANGSAVPAKTCDTKNVCLTETNNGSGGGISVSNTSSTTAAIDATNYNSTAIYARSADGAAIIGLGSAGAGVVAQSNSTDSSQGALEAQGSTSSTNLLVATNSATGGDCYIDAFGDLDCSGSIQGSVIRTVHRNGAGRRVVAYASESASATIEDVGTARMSDGVANVHIDPAFSSVMAHQWYYVFLTPLGDTRGLYVSSKTLTGFQVREAERGRNSLEFDYRIVANPVDGQNARLPQAQTLR
jgi:hypothetical protein